MKPREAIRVTVISLTVVVCIAGCSIGKKTDQSRETSVPSGSRMSPRSPMLAVKTNQNLYRAFAVATNVEPSLDTSISTRFSTVYNNLSVSGGRETSGPMLQAIMDLAGAFAFKVVDDEASRPFQERRYFPIDLNSGFSANGRDLFPNSLQEGVISALVTQLTGLPPTVEETQALKNAIAAIKPSLPNDSTGKRLLMAMLATMVLAGSHYH